jgi:hypothetical protein
MMQVILELLETASQDTTGIGAMLEEAHQAAARQTTATAAAGEDEISRAIAALFSGHGQQYQALAAQAQAFHQQFAANLKGAASTYSTVEQQIGQTLRDEITVAEQQVDPPITVPYTAPPVPTNGVVSLIIGGTSEPFTPALLPSVSSIYSLPGVSALLYTPEQFFPFTPQLGPLTLQQSVNQGVTLLNSALMAELGAGNHVTVWTTSQSSISATEEIRNLMAQCSPYANQLNFILTGDPNNPDGGILSRFTYGNGATIPFLQIPFNGSTPANSPYQVAIYTNQYDAISDFPEHPLNLISDANAIIGAATGRHFYEYPLGGYVQLPTSPGYTGNTTYYMLLDNQLPLLAPLRDFGGSTGNAFADLLQPDLRVIADMGYSSNEYANQTSVATIFDVPNLPNVTHDLITGTTQGIDAFGVDEGLLPQSMFPNTYPYLPTLNPDLTVDL